MIFENIANILAMIFSFAGTIMLVRVSMEMGGSMGHMFKLIAAGIFLAVFVHAGFELVATYNLLSEELLLPIMGTLLSLGSLCFIVGGYFGLKQI